MILKRLLYFAYYLRELNFKKFRSFLSHAADKSHRSSAAILIDVFVSSMRYNISILDYFHFRFYELRSDERAAYAGTGFMYEYQLKMNPPGERDVLENKISFLKTYKPFVKRDFATFEELKTNPGRISHFLAAKSNRLVLKGSKGQVGAEVKVIRCNAYNANTLLEFMESNEFDMAEEYVVQHPDLMKLSPSGLNTVRIFTQLDQGSVVYLGARLRITINSEVDNMAAGNIAAPVDIHTGKIAGPGVFSDITKNELTVHPVTGVAITDFQIPFWKETLEMMEQAVLMAPQNKSIGWDIAITAQGPELIEGNHNWCKLLWQLPVKRGMKADLEKYL